MLDFNTSILLKITSSILFLFSAMIWKKILKEGTQNYHFIFYRVITTVLVLLPLPLLVNLFIPNNQYFNYKIPNDVHFMDLIVAVAIGLFSFWGLYYYTKALQSGRFVFVAPLATISSAFSICTSIVLYNEDLSSTKTIALFLILGGLLFHQKDQLINFKFSKEVVLIVLFSIIWGVSFVLYLIPIKKFGALNFSILLEGCVLLSCIGLLLFHEKRIVPNKTSIQNLGWCFLMGIVVAFGSLLSNFSLTQFSVSFNILLGLVFEIIIITVGLFVYREKLSKKDWILITFASLGGFLMLL